VKDQSPHADLSELLKTLPPVVPRKDIDRYLGGLVSKGYLANLDSQGKGPRKFRCGRNIGYLRADLVEWLSSRSHGVE
jgi:hypothetical protein